MRRLGPLFACVLATCGAPEGLPPQPPVPPIEGPRIAVPRPVDAAVPDAPVSSDAPYVVPAAAVTAPEVWLKGSTHVHARPSGDSTTPIPEVLRWYEDRGYDFIVLTDHNNVSEIDPAISTQGQPTLRPPGSGMIVFAGTELTHNPSDCVPPGDSSGKCRIHVNVLGTTARPPGKIEWANRKTHERLAKYQAALDQQKALGGIIQINHPSWFWGMSSGLLAELARRGAPLVEIANKQFAPWNAGDADHLGLEAIWDGVLQQGLDIWGVASDDAHDYTGQPGAKYPAGGAWIRVKARRDPEALLAAIAAGRFYASSGVVLARAEVDGGELVVEIARGEPGTYTIDFIENGAPVARVAASVARRALPATGYVRAVVTRGDGAKAWIQPARRR